MSNEPGERRRRREAERARQVAAVEDAGDAPAPAPADGSDRASAPAPAGGSDGASAPARAGGSDGAPAPAPVSGTADGRESPPVTAAVPVVGDGARVPSRRELRELERRRALEAGEEAPVDVPVAPDRSAQGPHGRRSAVPGGEPHPPHGAHGARPPGPGTPGLLPAQRTGPAGAATPGPGPAGTDRDTRDALGAGPGAAASPDGAGSPTTDDVSSPGPRGDDLADDHTPDEPHRYTRVHLVVLLLVAGVLGFLIWSLVSGGTDDSASSAAPPVTVPSLSVVPTPHQGDL